ncbi:MAG: PepSY domain-containing protein, partial [Bryobacteraceae bacterium]|nr:PepSY domain-containing protein [Bryobacteraceae bacterium]
MQIRKVLFWLHLILGTAAGIVILIMSVTGVALMYERQILAWADRGFWSEPPPGAEKLPIETVLGKLSEQRRGIPSSITVRSDPAAPVEAVFDRSAPVYINPYTGAVAGEGSKGVRQFFRLMTDWHRWLGMEGEGRAVGRAITGACNLAFLFLVVTG